mgnify:CR=1 FL=1
MTNPVDRRAIYPKLHAVADRPLSVMMGTVNSQRGIEMNRSVNVHAALIMTLIAVAALVGLLAATSEAAQTISDPGVLVDWPVMAPM